MFHPAFHRRLILTATALFGLAAPAGAQELYPYEAPPAYSSGYSSYDGPYYDPAPAPGYGDEDRALDEITVYAPREVVGRSPTTGAPIERVTVSRVVSVRDLDLRTEWGVDELTRRVREAAVSACREIEANEPFVLDDDRSCYREALDRAMVQVDAAISGAQAYAYVDR